MFKEKCDSIEQYLRQHFEGADIEQANINDDQHYRIPTKDGLLMLKAGRNFIDDNSIEEILDKLERWDVANLLIENRKLGILVTDSGPVTYKRA